MMIGTDDVREQRLERLREDGKPVSIPGLPAEHHPNRRQEYKPPRCNARCQTLQSIFTSKLTSSFVARVCILPSVTGLVRLIWEPFSAGRLHSLRLNNGWSCRCTSNLRWERSKEVERGAENYPV